MIVRICIAVLICLLFVGTLVSCGGPKIVGTWNTSKYGKSVEFTFNKDGTGVVKSTDSKPELFKYKIDYSKKPIWLDVAPKGESQTLKMIVKIRTPDKFQLAASGHGNKRPTSFSDKKRVDIITFTRSAKH